MFTQMRTNKVAVVFSVNFKRNITLQDKLKAFQSYSSIHISIPFYLFMFGNLYLNNRRPFNLFEKLPCIG